MPTRISPKSHPGPFPHLATSFLISDKQLLAVQTLRHHGISVALKWVQAPPPPLLHPSPPRIISMTNCF